MNAMFYGCNRLETIYAGKGWNTDSVVNSDRMFYGCTSLVGEQGTKYDENHVDADYAHIDEGPTNPGYLSRKRIAYALLSTDETKLTFYYDDERSIRQGTSYLLMEANNHGWSEHAGSVTQVLIDSTFVAARPTSTNSWFLNMDKIDSIAGIEFLNTSAVTDMRRMFAGCVSLDSLDLSTFDTSHVTNMWAMFSGCDCLTILNVSRFNTSHVTNLARMFSGCRSLTSLDLSGFNTDSAKDMAGMFAGCKSLTALDLSRFNTRNVKYMSWLFSGCTALSSLNLNAFNTTGVAEMEYMFSGCDSLPSLDLKGFNTANVWNMEAMFNGCKNLETIYAGQYWSTDAVIESSEMFYGCTSLVGGQGTAYDEKQVDATRARIDGGASDPGYLTGRIITLNGDVNADGEVNIADVNCIIGVIHGGPDIYEGRADVNADGEVNIADINAVIQYVISAD